MDKLAFCEKNAAYTWYIYRILVFWCLKLEFDSWKNIFLNGQLFSCFLTNLMANLLTDYQALVLYEVFCLLLSQK